MALWGIFDRDMAKRLYRHANVSESLLGHRVTSHTSTPPPPVGGGVRRAGLIPNRNQRSYATPVAKRKAHRPASPQQNWRQSAESDSGAKPRNQVDCDGQDYRAEQIRQ